MASGSHDGGGDKPPPDDDAVGYCKPPKHSQFKPGQSGNVQGRRRRKLALNDIVEKAAIMPVKVKVDGRERRMPALEAILMLEVRKALEGDSRASRFVLQTFESRGLGGAVRGSQDDIATWVEGARERLARKVEQVLQNMDDPPDSQSP